MAKGKKQSRGIILIKKSNNLIESRYKFDIWETRFFLSVLGQIRREDEEFQVYRIWYRDVIKAFGLKSGDSYACLRTAAQSLMGKSFFVNYEENGVVREKQYHILREIDYLKAGQESKATESQEYIDVTVEQKMRPLLLQLQRNFTAYDLRNIVKLGVYPVRVYELLKQYESIGHRKLEVEEMKKMFEVVDQYKLFADFYRWVITPAVKEINAHTDLTITKVEKIKEGRRVVSLRFSFHVKSEDVLRKMRGEPQQKQLDFGFDQEAYDEMDNDHSPESETEKDKLFNLFHEEVVQKFGVTPSAFLQLLEEYTEDQVSQAIRVTKRAKAANQIKSTAAGFFVNALKGGYTDQKEEEVKRSVEAEKKKEEDSLLKAQIEYLKDEQAIRINERIREVTTENPGITEQAIQTIQENTLFKVLIQKKAKELGRDLQVEDYRQDRKLRELVKSKIFELAKDKFSDILEEFEQKFKEVKKNSTIL